MDEINKKLREDWTVIHRGMSAEAMKLSFQGNRQYALSKDEFSATKNDNYWALAIAIRDRIVERWIHSQQEYHKKNRKRVYYLSMEFLIGRLLGNNMYNLGVQQEVVTSLQEIGLDIDEIKEQEMDAGLGNGGLGRLAACFLDSMATLGIPAHGYGIRYDYGIFNQKIVNGYQVELPDEWLRMGSPWEFSRPEYTVPVRFYGKVNMDYDATGTLVIQWNDTEDILAVPYDIPIPGFKNDVVNTLRLWSARSTENFDFDYFNSGDYEQAVYKKIYSENISKVLYPNDSISQGKELRLKQEYFFTAATIADIIRRYRSDNHDIRNLPEKVVIQLNDTHPTMAVVELMRILIDDYFLDWETAWSITTGTFAYTNHTLMPEALECWSVSLLEKVLPRHMQIIYEINYRFLKEVKSRYPKDAARLNRMSLIDENGSKKVRMAYLAVISSFSVNGVSALHTDLLKSKLMKDFYEFYPKKFNNKTNGISQRQWLLKSNPDLSNLITEAIGDKWITDLDKLKDLVPLATDKSFQEKWREVKNKNKLNFTHYLNRVMNQHVNPQTMFDVQVKRIHEYKRQMLFLFYIVSQYLKIKHDPSSIITPRTFFLGGKAAPGYHTAKMIIKFANDIAAIINNDRAVNRKIKLVFLENYRVSLAERIFPASDLSEQISTASTEASGTGNMKFMINGALTVGTYDGANIEITEQVGEDNIFIFGLNAKEVQALRTKGYNPKDYIRRSPLLEQVFHFISGSKLSPQDPHLFDALVRSIYNTDAYMICADFDEYCKIQDDVSREYGDKELWTMKSILNVAHSGFFSSDRTIAEYEQEIWKLTDK